MDRYRTIGPNDDPSLAEGDTAFIGVNDYDAPENLMPGQVQAAVNIDFTDQSASTRGGFVCLPSLGIAPFQASALWTSRTSASDITWTSVAYGNGVFVAVASAGGVANCVMTSPDGVTWTLRTALEGTWNSVAFGNGLFVAVGVGSAGFVITSPDGITWTARTAAALNTWRSVTFGNNLFVAVASNGATRVMTSPDGITWTGRTAANAHQWWSVTYGNGLYVAVANNIVITPFMTSPDGITWTGVTDALLNYAWTSITFGTATFVAVASGGQVASSGDGATWTERTAPEANNWNAVTYANALFVAVASTGTNRVMTSPNGISWTAAAAAAANEWNGIGNGNNTFVAVTGTGTGNRVMTAGATSSVFASGIYSDPNDAGSRWIMLVGTNKVGFYAFGRTSRTVNINSAYTVSEQSTVVQCNNQVYIFRGSDETPLYWTGNWGTEFTVVPATTAGAGFESIPNSNQATFCQNRLWVKNGKDRISGSDVLVFDTYDAINNDFNLNTGSSDFIVTTYPFGDTTLIVFKNNSIFALNSVDGALADVTSTEITRTVGCVGINAVTSVGPDLVYVSDRNVNLLSLTSTNNAIQHKTLPLSRNIRSVFKRVNWEYGYKISVAFWDNKLFLALPLDNATSCSTVCVFNFITEQWYGEWNFSSLINMNIQGWAIASYLGEQRLHCITEDGRIFVTDEGPQDISGTTVAEISTSLTTRAFRGNNNNRVGRRVWADMGTWRPSFSVTSYVDGAGESEEILSDQTFSRSDSWIFNDSTYSLTNSGDNYNRAGRKDYAGLCSESIQPQSGFLPEMLQEFRLPIITRRKGRLAWFKIENTQGRVVLRGLGVEARAGDRGNFIQVI